MNGFVGEEALYAEAFSNAAWSVFRCEKLFRVFFVKTQVQEATSIWIATKMKTKGYLVSNAKCSPKNTQWRQNTTEIGQICAVSS